MKMTKHIVAAAAIVAAQGVWAVPEAASIEEATAKAAAENRTVIIEFTGRDWCGACKHLHGEIFSSKAFEDAVNDKYVVTELDYPRDQELVAKLSAAEIERRQKIMDSYGIKGLPTVVLTDADGLPFAIIVGTRKTPEEYLAALDKAQAVRAERDAVFAKAKGLSGMEKAKALAAGLELLPKACRDKYEDVLKEIIAIDTENALGYKSVLGAADKRVEQNAALQDILKTFEGHFDAQNITNDVAKLEEFLKRDDLVPEVRQSALSSVADCYAFLRDPQKQLEFTKAAYESAPDSRSASKLKKSVDYIENTVLPMLEATKGSSETLKGAGEALKTATESAKSVNETLKKLVAPLEKGAAK